MSGFGVEKRKQIDAITQTPDADSIDVMKHRKAILYM